jgi:hypothetical protein
VQRPQIAVRQTAVAAGCGCLVALAAYLARDSVDVVREWYRNAGSFGLVLLGGAVGLAAYATYGDWKRSKWELDALAVLWGLPVVVFVIFAYYWART